MKHIKPYKIFESVEDDTTAFQSEYDALVSKVKQAELEVKKYEKTLADKKLYVTKKGKVKKIVDTWGIFWDVTFYDHWDGHASGWVYDVVEGSEEMKEEPSDAIRELIACWDILSNKDRIDKLNTALDFNSMDSPDRLAEHIMDRLSEDDEVIKKSDAVWEWDNFIFTIGDSSLKIEVDEDSSHEEGDPKKDSYIMFKLSSNSEIKSIKNKSRTIRD